MVARDVLDGARRSALHDLGLLDTGDDDAFDRFTRLAGELLDVPVSLVSLVDGDRQYFKSQQGLPGQWAEARQTPLSHSFCQHAVSTGQPLIVEDARDTPLVADNLAVRDLGVIAYAGMPLILDDGHAVGALCAIDGKPRRWSERELRILEDLAAAVKALLDLRAALARQGLHDRLTGLPNRALMVAHCRQLLGSTGAEESLVGLAVGVDGLGLVNEAYGPAFGDQVLAALGERLADLIRKEDALGRLEGDLFVVLCPGVEDEREALALAHRVREGVAAQPLSVGTESLSITVTVGLSSGVATTDATELLTRAEEAMRQAKTRHGSVRMAEDGQRELAAARLRLRGALRGAVERGEISLAYQPIVDMETAQTKGFEALARWTHPELGPVNPADFIPVAEATGEIIVIGEHVLREACRQLAEWRRSAGEELFMSINLAPLQLEQANVADVVGGILAEAGVPGDAVSLEITEGVLLEADPLQQRSLMRLRNLGVHVVLDDFGTGYSALAYLKRFPIDVLKIDRSFVDGIELDRQDAALVEAIVAMGTGMEMEIVAEGVETTSQQELLRRLGVRLGQGFLFSRPRPAAEIEPPPPPG